MPTRMFWRRPALGASAGRRLEQRGGVGDDVLAQTLQLVGTRHPLVEHLLGERDQRRMRDPGAVVPFAHLAQLVGAHLVHRLGVGVGIVLDRNLRRHAAHREGAAAVAGLDQQLRVGPQERRLHRHLPAIRHDERRVVLQRLDRAEDVVPPAAVEPDDVIAELVEDLVHLERRRQRFDQDRHLDRAGRDPERRLRVQEDLVPQPRLEVALHLRQVEIRAGAGARRAPSRCERGRGRSRTASPARAGRRRRSDVSGRWKPRGRTISVASGGLSV